GPHTSRRRKLPGVEDSVESQPEKKEQPQHSQRSQTDFSRRSLRSLQLLSRTMLIPSIDLKHGAVVQLVQGERLAIRDDDVQKWVRRFARFAKVQVIDLDAAMGSGDNLALVRQIVG